MLHRPTQTIPEVGIEADNTRTNSQMMKAKRMERAKAEKNFDEYVLICTKQKVSRQKVIIEKDDVAKGLQEFTALHGITKLVVGAAADEHYSNALFSWSHPWSKTAVGLMKAARRSCKIWFTCKGHLICTREGYRNVIATPPPPTEEALHEAELDLLSVFEMMEE